MQDHNANQVPIQVDWNQEPAPVYANGAQISAGAREFALAMTDFAAFPGRGAPLGQNPMARVVANVRMNPETFYELTLACIDNWNKFGDALAQQAGTQVVPRLEVSQKAPGDSTAKPEAPMAAQAPVAPPS